MSSGISNLFNNLSDPRISRTKKHPLESILSLVLCGSLAGIDDFVGYEDFGHAHQEILEKFIDFPDGIPSHDTIGRVISRIDVDSFNSIFMDFSNKLRDSSSEVIAIDGKTSRGSHDHANGKSAHHIITAWADSCDLAIGQIKTKEKSNEITAIPELLDLLDIWNQIITIDAMGCQRDICKKIKCKEADYVISLKGNQRSLHSDIKDYFEDKSLPITHEWEEFDKGHGRIEHRQCMVTDKIDWLQSEHDWPGLRTIAVVYSTREIISGKNKKTTKEARYYISSLEADAEKIAKAARKHWSVENKLHWVLDVTFNEDGSRIRNNNAPEIINMTRKWALNIINKNKGKLSVARMMKKVAMNGNELLKLINNI